MIFYAISNETNKQKPTYLIITFLKYSKKIVQLQSVYQVFNIYNLDPPAAAKGKKPTESVWPGQGKGHCPSKGTEQRSCSVFKNGPLHPTLVFLVIYLFIC